MKNLLENVILLLVTAILVLGIYNYVKSIEEPKEEDPIVDVLPDDEQPGENETPGTDVEPGENETPGTDVEPGEDVLPGEDENISTIVIYGSDSSRDLTIQYEKGMTWGDWLNSKYNTFGAEKKSYILFPQYGYLTYGEYGDSSEPSVSTTEKIDNTYTYSTM